ncbi:MAG: prephenate dehydrogenase/arogenate dehydrogenase family protein [Phototrophicales bacterium]|nr:MAG: prephenate dehydrogenase/arogenate dehydrogenase family protein [Phototrophicales bacterium]
MLSGGFRARQISVVGLGLMGGSLALALRPYTEAVIGVDPNPFTRAAAVERGIVDSATDNLRDGVHDSDVVVLAAPVRAIINLVEKRIGSYLRSNTLLIDIGSTKADICAAMGTLPIGIQAVGGHPMTGKETSGIEAADANLYQNRPFVLCPTRRTTPAARLRALALVEALGAVAIEMDAQRHDRVVAAISHLPYILSAALVATVAAEGSSDDAVWRLAAGGFRDMSRLAAQDLSMMGDILSTNTQAVATLLALFRMQLAMIEAMLIDRDHQKLTELLRPAREARLAWVKQLEGK